MSFSKESRVVTFRRPPPLLSKKEKVMPPCHRHRAPFPRAPQAKEHIAMVVGEGEGEGAAAMDERPSVRGRVGAHPRSLLVDRYCSANDTKAH
jgi:hypothetical protein